MLDSETTVAVGALLVSLASFVFSHLLARNAEITSVRPVLIFEYSKEQGWVLHNIGRGAALNVVIVHRKAGAKEWFSPVRVPPLAVNGSMVPHWLGHVNDLALGVSYTDIDDRAYSSETASDLTKTHRHNVFPRWQAKQIARHWERNPLRLGETKT